MKLPRPRPELQALQPYRSSETAGGRVLLHANENPYPPPPEVLEELFAMARGIPLNRYPAPDPGELIEEIASYVGVDPTWVWIGDGSNEILLQACLAYGGPGRTALLFEPTYRMHSRQAAIVGTTVETARRNQDFSIDADDAVEAIEVSKPDVVFLCTPNNPTGNVIPSEDLHRFADAASGLVVIDEAYYEFVGRTFVDDLKGFPNVVVVRTLSKAFRLAGIRLGYAIAHPALLDEFRRVRMPYAQSAFTQAAALIALRRRDQMLDVVPKILAERERLAEALGRMDGTAVYLSGANFLFFRHPEHARLLEALADRGIVIRDFSHLEGCERCLRVTVGTPDQNDAFLEVAAGLR